MKLMVENWKSFLKEIQEKPDLDALHDQAAKLFLNKKYNQIIRDLIETHGTGGLRDPASIHFSNLELSDEEEYLDWGFYHDDQELTDTVVLDFGEMHRWVKSTGMKDRGINYLKELELNRIPNRSVVSQIIRQWFALPYIMAAAAAWHHELYHATYHRDIFSFYKAWQKKTPDSSQGVFFKENPSEAIKISN